MIDRTERLTTLIGEIYEAGLEPERWDAVMTKMCDELGAVGGLLGYYEVSVSRGHTASCVRLDPELLALYHEQHVDNIWNRALERYHHQPAPRFLDEPVPFRILKKTRFYADILAPQGLAASLVIDFLRDSRGVGGTSFMFDKVAAEQPRDTLKIASLLGAHVARAVGLSDRLNAAAIRRQAAEEAIDQLRRGVLALDEDGAVRFMNSAARQMLAAGDGLLLKKRRLHATNAVTERELHALVARTARPPELTLEPLPRALLVHRPSGQRPYLIMIVPFRSERLWPPAKRPAALCFITDMGAEQRVAAQAVAQLFALTPQETRIALAVAEGRALPEVARLYGMQLTTARTHLQNVFDKTGVRSQAALARLITHVVRGLPLDEQR